MKLIGYVQDCSTNNNVASSGSRILTFKMPAYRMLKFSLMRASDGLVGAHVNGYFNNQI